MRQLLFFIAACAPPPNSTLPDKSMRVAAQNPVVTNLRLQPRESTLAPGEQLQFRVLVKWSDGATIVPALRWKVEGGDVSPGGLYIAAAVPGTYRVVVALDSGTLSDTAVVTVVSGTPTAIPQPGSRNPPSPEPPGPQPSTARGTWKEPPGYALITRRDFTSKSKTDVDRGPTGSQSWDGVEYRYRNMTIAEDPRAPLSPAGVLRALYPRIARIVGTYSPGVVQSMPFTGATYGARHYRKLYVRTAFRVSANWQGHPSSTNKMFFIRSGGARTPAINEPIVRLRGVGSGPLALSVDLQGSPRDKRNRPGVPMAQQSLSPNTPGAAEAGANNIPRGQWQVLEAVLEMGVNGQANGRLRLWLNGTLTHDYSDIEYEKLEGRTYFWDVLHIAPTWGGGEGTINELMWLDFDEFYVSGAP